MALRKLLLGLKALASQAPQTAALAALELSSPASRPLSTASERISMHKLYKSLGMNPPKPRTMSPEAVKTREALTEAFSGSKGFRRPRAARSRLASKPARQSKSSSKRAMFPLGTRPSVLSPESAPAILRLWSSETTAEEDKVDRILDAGAKRLFESEEGREKLRDGSFNIDETAKTILQAAEEALHENEEPRCDEDAKEAHDAAEEIKGGKQGGKVAQRAKEKVVGLGQTG